MKTPGILASWNRSWLGRRVFSLLGWGVLGTLLALVIVRFGFGVRFGTDLPYMPHGHCYLWNPHLLWLHVVSDSFIAAAYVAISGTLTYLVVKSRKSLPFHWMMLAFATFIVACGATHIVEVLTVWYPRYWFAGLVKLVTAIASVATAGLLFPLVPKIFKLLETAQLSSERKLALESAHAELGVAYEKIKQFDNVKTAFFANISHELRTPLALILGPVEKLLSQEQLTDSQRSDLGVIRRNALLLHKLVNDLLDISKLESGKLAMNYANADLSKAVRLSASYFESVGAERLIQFSIVVPDSVPAQIDLEKVQRILLNLLANAFKYTPEGGDVCCSLSIVSQEMASIVVEDSGPGIPVEHRDQIFERFVQGEVIAELSACHRFGGTGLGLSIVKEFTDMHGGIVTVDESAMGGARFEVRLPLKAPVGSAVRDVEIETRGTSSGIALGAVLSEATGEKPLPPVVLPLTGVAHTDRPIILVAEDNPDMKAFITGILEPEFETVGAMDGSQALELARSHQPDLIVSDIMMAGMSGAELLWRLRGEPLLAGIPVIILSAQMDEVRRTELLRAGAADYIGKPFVIEELRARVRNHVTTKRARDTLQHILSSRDQDIGRLAVEVTRRTSEMKEAKDTAEQASRAKDRFMAVLSHELRTPLMPVLTGVLELESETDLRPGVRDIIHMIRRNVELESRLIDDLLDLTRIAKGKIQVDFAPVDVHELLRTVAQQFDCEIRRKALRFTMSLAAGRHWISADAPRLLQVFGNLINNAIKFTPEIGTVAMTTRNDTQGHLVVEIADSGIGISPAALPRLFKPFNQASESITQHYGGLGLGLAVSKGLVDAHGGTIVAESLGENRGSTFIVSLGTLESPASLVRPPERGAKAPSEIQAQGTSRQLRILLVEDHEDTRITLSRLIKRWGYEVLVADSVNQALTVGRNKPFDLLISDLGLPDGSGTEVIRALRQEPSLDGLKAIAVSGFGMEEDILRSHEAGFNQHLTKPVAVEQLRTAIEALLKQDG